MAESTGSPICPVCLEEFTYEGDKCPKLLPCSHTLCYACLGRLKQWGITHIQCPECQAWHNLPPRGVGFQTNRYILYALDLERKITELENKEVQFVLCEVHQKPCVMFCLKKECWKVMCPKCPAQEHQDHNVVSLRECIQESQEMKRMQQGVADIRKSLEKYEAQVTEAKFIIPKKEAEANEAIEKAATELKMMIDKKFMELKRKVRQSCDDELRNLEGICKDINQQIKLGLTIEDDITNRSEKNISKAVQQIIQFKSRISDFQKLARQERRGGKNYRLLQFHKSNNQVQYSSLMGDLVSTSHVISDLRGNVKPDGGKSSSSSTGSARAESRAATESQEFVEYVGPVRSSRGLNGAHRSAPY